LTVALPAVPSDRDAQLRWLVDRAAIGDLLVEYARCVDERDWPGFAALYTADAVLEIAGSRRQGHAEIEAAGELVASYGATHHMSATYGIGIDGDRATARANCIASHVPDMARPREHADGGVVYECTCERTPDGWRFSRVRGRRVWVSGGQLPGESPPASSDDA
jgi:ketosteroid isomerase-like protein